MTEPRHAARWLILALALSSLHCSGGQFISADPEGSGGKAGAGNGKISPGPTGGGAALPGGLGGSSAGGPQTIEPGDVIEPAGGNAGQPGVIGTGGGGTGNDPGEEPDTLELTDCGPNAFGTGIVPTLYSTLDNGIAITEPMIGELGFVSNAEGDYHGEQCGTSINIDQAGDYVKYHYQDNDVRHFSPQVGAMDFWYQPWYSHTDGLNHHLFSTANWASAGGFRMRKAAADNANAFQVIVASDTLETMELSVPADAYELSPGQWSRITLIWYLAPDLPRRYVRLFFDGNLAAEVEAGNTFLMAPDVNGYFVFGVWDFADPEHAAGLLDDFKVFARGP